MRAGDLRHRITIQEQIKTVDGVGGFDLEWTTYGTVWAAVWPVSAKEITSQGKPSGEITHKVRIRYLSGITDAMRIIFGTRTLEIVAPPINNDERNVSLDLLCREETT